MMALGRGGKSARENAGNHHQTLGSHFTGMSGVRGGGTTILGPRADHGGDAGFDQKLHAFHALFVGEQGPVAHRSAIDHTPHALLDQVLTSGDKSIVIDFPVFKTGRHEGGNGALENRSVRR